MLVSEAVQTYLTNIRITKRPRTLESAAQVLSEFRSHVGEMPLEDLKREHLLSYLAALKDKRQTDRTCANKYIRVRALLRYHNINLPNDRPRFTPALPEVYTDSELATLFSACDIRQRALYKVLLCCGLRKEEVRWLRWTDLEDKMLHIQPHPPQFNPKNHESRRIPVPPEVLSLLRQMPRRPGVLIFPTESGRPNKHFLLQLKRLVTRAGLDEDRFWLHKFRATYATNLLRRGVDLRTVQMLLGHRDTNSTMRYLRPLEGDALYARIAAAFAS